MTTSAGGQQPEPGAHRLPLHYCVLRFKVIRETLLLPAPSSPDLLRIACQSTATILREESTEVVIHQLYVRTAANTV